MNDWDKIEFAALVRCKARLGDGTVIGRPARIKNQTVVQLTFSQGKKVRHENVPLTAVGERLRELLETADGMTVVTVGRTYEFRRTKKGKLLSRSSSNTAAQTVEGNDRVKNRVLDTVPALVEAGVMTADGKVYADKQEKFRQINRFTELIADVIGDEKTLSIVDFGCGKSYLGFAVEHYCRKKGIYATVTGIDLKADVIETCEQIAERCGLDNMRFVCGDIADYPLEKADMVISLHACDTATDYALYNAVRAKVKYIFSVPCCQHELNATMTDDSLLSKYGIVRERTAALVTDAVRAALLESMGYRVQVLEYVDSEHSLKNLMIRAVFADTPAEKREKAKQDAERLLHAFGANQCLYRMLYEN